MQIKKYNEILTQMIKDITDSTPLSNFNPGSVIRTLAEVYAEAAAELYSFIANVLKQAYLSTSSGHWLDLKAKEYGVIRKQALKTEGRIIFARLEPKNESLVIPSGSIIATGVDENGKEKKYITVTRAILLSGELDVSVPVAAEQSGVSYNVGPGSIKRMKTFIKGIDKVDNLPLWITKEGADEEDDESLRKRTFLAWEELARGGTKSAYMSWAMSVNGVSHVWVNDTLPRGQGTVDVYIMSQSGPPSQVLINQVKEVINKNKPICSDVMVKAPGSVDIPVTVHITPINSFDTEVMETEIRRRLWIYFSGEFDPELPWLTPLGVGRNVIHMQLIEIIMSVEGVFNLELITPDRDMGIAPYEFPRAGYCTITFGDSVDV